MSLSQGFRPAWGVLESKLIILVGKWAIGAAGAVGVQTGAVGLSLTRTGAGAYTIQLLGSKKVAARTNAILNADINVFATDAIGATKGLFVKNQAIVDSTGTITFLAVDETGTTREIPTGASVAVTVHARLSSTH